MSGFPIVVVYVYQVQIRIFQVFVSTLHLIMADVIYHFLVVKEMTKNVVGPVTGGSMVHILIMGFLIVMMIIHHVCGYQINRLRIHHPLDLILIVVVLVIILMAVQI